MSSTSAAAVLALAAGVCGAAQVAVQGRLGERVGSLEAVVIATVVSAIVLLPVLLLVRRGVGSLRAAPELPWWLLLGGVLGAFIVLSITIAGPRIGTTATVALLIAGQLAAASVIDRYGWFGSERVGLTAARIAGIVLLVAGAALILRR